MTEDNPGAKKAAPKKTPVRKKNSASTVDTRQDTPGQQTSQNNTGTGTGTGKTAQKKASTKKRAVKKTSATQSPGGKVKVDGKDTSTPTSRRAADKEILSTINSIVKEMRSENESRDKQMMTLVNEIHQGFRAYAEHTNAKVNARDQEMDQLSESLKSAFSNVEDSSKNSDERSVQILKALSESIMMDHEQTLQEVQQQKKLQDEQIEHLTELEQRRASRSRWLAVPGTILGIIAIIYMFYVVNVMEAAMTNISSNMDGMQTSVGNMSNKMDTMAEDTHSMQSGVNNMNVIMEGMAADTKLMSTDMNLLNKNLTQMSYDLNVMTRNVSPTMKGMHDMMPWSP